MEENGADILTLTDLDGNEVDFDILDIVPYGESEYAVLLPVDDESEDPEAVILELLPAGDGEADSFQGVEDESVLQGVFNLFLERNREDFESEPGS